MAQDANLQDTSAALAINAMKKAHQWFVGNGKRPPCFRALFIEKNERAHARLAAFLESSSGPIAAESRCGDFLDLRGEILKWSRDDFTFFLDPTGYTENELPNLEPLLRRQNSELLINFMYDFINRGMGIKEGFDGHKIGLTGRIPDLSGLSTSEREEAILRSYRNEARRRMPASSGRGPWSAVVRVLDPECDRVKYHLIYLTRSALGVEKFYERMDKIDRVQHAIKHAIKLDKQQRASEASGQASFDFGDVPTQSFHPSSAIDEIKDYWLRKLRPTPQEFSREDMADLVEETGWTISDIQSALLEMIRDGKVMNLDAKKYRSARGVDCEKRERLVLVE
jgi:three-Cys-motif partner protein